MRILILFLCMFFITCGNSQDIKSISTIELKQLLSKEKIQLLDVRTPEEVSEGFIKSAKFINVLDDNFTQKASELLDKSKPVYVYCRTGNRSVTATEILKENGFKVYLVDGGYTQWQNEN